MDKDERPRDHYRNHRIGLLDFNMIAGDQDSLKSAGADVMERTIELYEE